MFVILVGATILSCLTLSQTELAVEMKVVVTLVLVTSCVLVIASVGMISILAIPVCALGNIGVLIYLKVDGWPTL